MKIETTLMLESLVLADPASRAAREEAPKPTEDDKLLAGWSIDFLRRRDLYVSLRQIHTVAEALAISVEAQAHVEPDKEPRVQEIAAWIRQSAAELDAKIKGGQL